jgi:hypothetical protein
MRRTAVINQLRGLLLERDINLRNGRCHVGAAWPGILEDADARLSFVSRVLLAKTKPANSFRTVRFLRSASSSERRISVECPPRLPTEYHACFQN